MESNLSPTTSTPADLAVASDAAAPLGALGTGALMFAHCAGMVDIVALPVWVGTLIGSYRFDPQQAGLLATLFLAAAVASSVFFSPRLNRLPARVMVTIGFCVAMLSFFGMVLIDRYRDLLQAFS